MLSSISLFLLIHLTSAAFQSPPSFTVSQDNSEIFDNGEPGIKRDGGGSGTLNGFKAIAFSDTYKNKDDGNLQFFQSNSFTYYGYSNPSDPRNQKELGDNGQYGPALYLTPAGDENPTGGEDRVAIWPSSNLVAFNESHAIGSAAVLGVQGSWTFNPRGNTFFTVQMADSGITVDRVVERAFTNDEINYGDFSFLKGADGYLYLFGKSKSGIRAAKAPLSTPYDKNTFTYWDGSSWATAAPAVDDTKADIFTHNGYFSGPYTGDVWYDPYHQSLACVYMESAGGTFYLVSPKDGQTITGGWTDAVKLASYSATNSGDIVYAGHVHPEWDESGKTLLMSYSDGGATRRMVSLTWDN